MDLTQANSNDGSSIEGEEPLKRQKIEEKEATEDKEDRKEEHKDITKLKNIKVKLEEVLKEVKAILFEKEVDEIELVHEE